MSWEIWSSSDDSKPNLMVRRRPIDRQWLDRQTIGPFGHPVSIPIIRSSRVQPRYADLIRQKFWDWLTKAWKRRCSKLEICFARKFCAKSYFIGGRRRLMVIMRSLVAKHSMISADNCRNYFPLSTSLVNQKISVVIHPDLNSKEFRLVSRASNSLQKQGAF
jgi:hypothetical protein